MIIAATGHRPDKLGGYDPAIEARLQKLASEYLDEARPAVVISGMALGWDTAIALASLEARIPLIAAVPFRGQDGKWSPQGRERYADILVRATEVHVVSEGGYASHKMQLRNQWMVDHCNRLVALWNGTPGGTANCVNYAISVGKRDAIDNLWPQWVKANEGGS